MNKFAGVFVAALAFCSYAAPSQAQTRTWVSGVGDDLNPCSRTAPCKTFAGAISKTAAGGKINCLDPGGFGAVTITKSIEIDCLQFPGGILSAGVNGVNVPTAGIKVILRGIEIFGAGTGINGVNITASSEVMIDHCFIAGVTGTGVVINSPTGFANVFITDTNITQAARGVLMSASGAGSAVATLNNVDIFSVSTSAVETNTNATFAAISHSNLSGSGTGSAAFTSAGTGTIVVNNSTLWGNSFAIRAGSSGSRIFISNNTIAGNNTSISIAAGATVLTGANNKVDPPGTTPNGTFTNQ